MVCGRYLTHRRDWETGICLDCGEPSLARIEAGTDETLQAAQPEGQEPEKAPKSTGKESDQ